MTSRPFILILTLILAVLLGAGEACAGTRHKRGSDDSRYASIVIDADTGAVLSASAPSKSLHPASLTKMMTLLLTFDALADGRLRTSDYIRVSSHAASMSPSKLGIRAGGKIRVEDAIRAVAVKSANDIAVALAEAAAGTESRFAEHMNIRARQIGMTHTRFVNASGLHSMFQVSTARDMAVLARYILKTYPDRYKYFGLRQFSFGGRVHPNHNRLMDSYAGMDGFKTGYTSQSGFNLVASARRGDRRLIGVVFGGRTAAVRNNQMARLLNIAFAGKGPQPAPDRLEAPVRTAAATPAATAIPPVPSPAAAALSDPIGDRIASVIIDPSANMAALAPAAGEGDSDENDTPRPTRKGRSGRKVIPSGKGILALPAADPQPPAAPFVLARLSDNDASAASTASAASKAWAIQIGSYQSRDSTDRALYSAIKKLPSDLRHANPVVAPYKSLDDGWMFRARLGNLDAAQARRACTQFRNCLVLPPGAH